MNGVGMAGKARRGVTRLRKARMAWQARHGLGVRARHERLGIAWQARRVRLGTVRKAWPGPARHGR